MEEDKIDNEQDLVKRLVRGEEAAMEQLFRMYYMRLYYYALKATGSSMDAEDIAQDVLLNFWVAVKNKQVAPDKVEAYLFRMVRNQCLNHLQRQRMIDEKNGTIIAKFYTELERYMDEVTIQEELYFRIKQEFIHLTPIQFQVMKYIYIDGLPIPEIAGKLNTTPNNIRNHKARALDRLKSLVEKGLFFIIILFLLFF